MKLYPYQLEAVEWIKKKRLALLALDMGLGKTAIVVRAADELKIKKIIVVCPSIARLTWEREIAKWSLASSLPKSIRILKKRNEKPLSSTDINICSFDYASHNFNSLRDLRADLLVVDESHFLKSIDAKRTRAILSREGVIRGVKNAYFVTGTPMPNAPHELWALLHTFGLTKLNYDAFIIKFCDTYDFNGRLVVSGAKHSALPELRQLLDKIMLRRKTSEVLKDLPAVRISELPLEADMDDLTPELHVQFKRLNDMVGTNFTDPLSQLAMLESVAESISSLRRFCVMKKIKPVCDLVMDELENKAYEKIIIFCHHREAVTETAERLRAHGAVSVHGGVNADERQRRIDSFQNDKSCKVFVANIGTAGTNITLTAASEVLFLEQDYVPGNNAQAIARSRRIGQTKSVNVRIAHLADTIDEKINEILTRKMKGILELLG